DAWERRCRVTELRLGGDEGLEEAGEVGLRVVGDAGVDGAGLDEGRPGGGGPAEARAEGGLGQRPGGAGQLEGGERVADGGQVDLGVEGAQPPLVELDPGLEV